MKRNFIILGTILLFFLTSCQKELSDNFTVYSGDPRNDTVWTATTPSSAPIHQLARKFFPDLIIDSFDCTTGDTLTLKDDIEIRIPGAACTNNNGIIVSGKVKLEFFRLKTRGDFIKFFKPTTAGKYLLESAGGFFIRLSSNGQELKLAPNASITVRFRDTEDAKHNMQVFHAKETIPFISNGIDTAHTWIRHTDTSWIKTWQKTDSATNALLKGYELSTNQLRWVGANRYIDSNVLHTNIFAYLPQNFTNKNTVMYAVFSDHKTVVNLSSDFRSKAFTAPQIPRGAKIKILSFSVLGTDLYMGIREVNDVGTMNTYKIEPQKKSLQDILKYIESL
ncbi:MAG: hypothetical protein RLZZ429_523 [Bacteroidota bacterium]|jgi:hypothetical protein